MKEDGIVIPPDYVIADGTVLVSTTGLDKRIDYCNAAFVEASGYPRDALIGQPLDLTVHPDMPAEVLRDLWATLEAGVSWSALVKHRRKTGEACWVQATVTPLLEARRSVGYMAVHTGPTPAQVQAAEALYAAMRRVVRTQAIAKLPSAWPCALHS